MMLFMLLVALFVSSNIIPSFLTMWEPGGGEFKGANTKFQTGGAF